LWLPQRQTHCAPPIHLSALKELVCVDVTERDKQRHAQRLQQCNVSDATPVEFFHLLAIVRKIPASFAAQGYEYLSVL
jgi:hypothetical protein